MAVACLALFMAIGGGTYALAALPKRSVGSAQLKRGAVRGVNIRNSTITGIKVKNDSLTGADINEASLSIASVASAQRAATATSATSATTATNANHANAAAAVDRVVYVSAAGGVPPAPTIDQSSVAGASAACPAGTFAVGGGVGVEDRTSTSVVDSFPEPGGRAWTARVDNNDTTAAHPFTVVAIWLAAGGAG